MLWGSLCNTPSSYDVAWCDKQGLLCVPYGYQMSYPSNPSVFQKVCSPGQVEAAQRLDVIDAAEPVQEAGARQHEVALRPPGDGRV